MAIIQRHMRNIVVQVQPEVTYGVDPGGWLASHAVLVASATYNIVTQNVDRDLIRPYFGGSEQLFQLMKFTRNSFVAAVHQFWIGRYLNETEQAL